MYRNSLMLLVGAIIHEPLNHYISVVDCPRKILAVGNFHGNTRQDIGRYLYIDS